MAHCLPLSPTLLKMVTAGVTEPKSENMTVTNSAPCRSWIDAWSFLTRKKKRPRSSAKMSVEPSRARSAIGSRKLFFMLRDSSSVSCVISGAMLGSAASSSLGPPAAAWPSPLAAACTPAAEPPAAVAEAAEASCWYGLTGTLSHRSARPVCSCSTVMKWSAGLNLGGQGWPAARKNSSASHAGPK